ncbi:MAG: hydroxymethylbilane synthase [Candidatus Latescibacterota bacterium]|nr:MAG: hydroxymethylbilane synthase [Candidatus Latescibacterota bacterium]
MTEVEKHEGSRVRIGTRGSELARWQTNHIKALLAEHRPDLEIEIEVITTQGDRILASSLPSLDGKGVFTAELETALLNGEVDIAVHSMKDVPTDYAQGLTIGAIPLRANPADVLVSRRGFTLETLPRGAVVGTSSPRRASQLLRNRADLNIEDIRGNVDTRIRKAYDRQGIYDAIVLAYAGLERLGRLDDVTEVLQYQQMLPAPGQGAIGVQCRNDDHSRGLLHPINDADTELAVTAERAFLIGLGGGCALPICALGEHHKGELRLRGRVGARDGSKQIDVVKEANVRSVDEARLVGIELAKETLAAGAGILLNAGN